jgi:hypothetical protein
MWCVHAFRFPTFGGKINAHWPQKKSVLGLPYPAYNVMVILRMRSHNDICAFHGGKWAAPPPTPKRKMSTSDLFDACWEGDIARVRQAVADGVDVRKVVDKDWYNETLLHRACL